MSPHGNVHAAPPWPAGPADHVCGLDLGQAQDHTALAVLERRWAVVPGTGRRLPSLTVGHLARWPLQTSYTTIAADLAALVRRPPLRMPQVAVDKTGVGLAVLEIIRQARPAARLVPVLITGGFQVTRDEDGVGWHLPKKELVSTLQALLQARRLRIAALPERALLTAELAAFRVRVTPSANETFECLVAGTMVETAAGPKPIESVRAGELVLTREGYKRVTWSGMTKEADAVMTVRFTNGSSLTGTPDHLAWTQARGWVPLGRLAEGDALLGLPSPGGYTCPHARGTGTPKPSPSTASPTVALPVTLTTTTAGRAPSSPCTGPSGSITTGPSLLAITSTTRTRTRTTTGRPTSSASARVSTPNDISRRCPRPTRCVPGAAGLFAGETGEARSVPSAVPTGPGCQGNTSASSAASGSSPTATAGTGRMSGSAPRLAATATATVTTTGRLVPVYDLVVEDAHEFFANGILVHNSWRERDHDDLVLAVAMAAWLASRPPPPRPAAGGQRPDLGPPPGSGWQRNLPNPYDSW